MYKVLFGAIFCISGSFIALAHPIDKEERNEIAASTQESTADQLKRKTDQLRAFALKQNLARNEQDLPTSRRHGSVSQGPSWQLLALLDFTKDSIACYGASWVVANLILQRQLSQKTLFLMGLAGAATPRLPNYFKYILDFII